MKAAVTKVIDTLTQEDFHEVFQKLLERYNTCIAVSCLYYQYNCSDEKSLETYLMILVIWSNW